MLELLARVPHRQSCGTRRARSSAFVSCYMHVHESTPAAVPHTQSTAAYGQVLSAAPPTTTVHRPPVMGAAGGHTIGVTQFHTCPTPPAGAFWQVHWSPAKLQRLAAAPPGT